MDKKVLVDLVEKEASELKKRATKKELAKLNFEALDPDHKNLCIYGQMTGNCFSKRSAILINKCCEKVYNQKNSIELYKCELNGKPDFSEEYEVLYRRGKFSPIEVFITFPRNILNGNNKMLIDYLKGKINKLNFKPF